MQIYIDTKNRCHTESAPGRRAFEAPFFDGKCREFVEGYVFVPKGESWEYHGNTYRGELVAPVIPYSVLDSAQRNYEKLMKSYREGVDSV